jgi:hypothetical protein
LQRRIVLVMRCAAFVLMFLYSQWLYAESITIRKVEGSIVVDGDVSDSGWSKASRVENFLEFSRSDNAAPPVRTTAWVTYDDRYFYVAFRNDDPQPASIRAPFVDRDQVAADQDFVSVILDTQNDRRSAFEFKMNPRGVQTDDIYNEAISAYDLAPDFFFQTASSITENGWNAEMRIPLSSLRYRDEGVQSWGIILIRNYPRDFRYVMTSTRLPKGRSCYLCHASTLDGLTDLPRGGHITIAPYSTAAREEKRVGSGLSADPVRGDTGLDLKWSLSSKMTVDATLNPDFSQIESDIPQVSVNSRFAFSYPEKRAFFLEGVDLLTTPMRAVYTRSIASPAWGIRATGQTGSTAWTLLAAEDRGGGATVLPGAEGSSLVRRDYRSLALIGRARKAIGSSFAGVLFTARESEGGGHNRVFGPDFLWKLTGADKLQGQYLFSSTTNPVRPDLSPQFDGRSANGHASRLVYNRDTSRYDVFAHSIDYSKGFRADNGFIPWAGLHGNFFEVGGHLYPKRGFASYVRPYIGIGRETAWRGGGIGLYFEGKYGTSGWIGYHPIDQERVGGTFTRRFTTFDAHLQATLSRHFPSISLDGTYGERVDYANARIGRGGSVTFTSSVRPTTHLEGALNVTHEWLDVDAATLYTADIERLKLSYVFDQRSLARVIVQKSNTDRTTWLYADPVSPRDGDLTLSALYGYRINWQTTFYVGYGDFRILDESNRFAQMNRSLFMKASYAFQR